jgi:hypothetical protein
MSRWGEPLKLEGSRKRIYFFATDEGRPLDWKSHLTPNKEVLSDQEHPRLKTQPLGGLIHGRARLTAMDVEPHSVSEANRHSVIS